jgi:prepilin-type N-terminal cleavage/methylation domain-containing protein
MATQRNQQGFTLIEIAIVLVIIGLLLGGILKGQELITSARVRSLISQQDGIKAAFYGFQDRYRALPGDYSSASTNIQMTTTGANANGNGNGRVDVPGGAAPDETILVWEHLSKSGFINGNYVYTSTTIADANTPKNAYGQFVQLGYDLNYYTLTGGVAAVSGVQRHNLKTGSQIPVEIAAEVDRKIDDGNGATGSFVFSVYTTPTGTAPTAPGAAPNCMSTTGVWNLVGQTAINCGGASLM